MHSLNAPDYLYFNDMNLLPHLSNFSPDPCQLQYELTKPLVIAGMSFDGRIRGDSCLSYFVGRLFSVNQIQER
jgi:hypothetical protein